MLRLMYVLKHYVAEYAIFLLSVTKFKTSCGDGL